MDGKPPQYQIGIDTFLRMEANCTQEEIFGFIRGNIDKYVWRKKNQTKEDFEKIIAYAEWGIRILDREHFEKNALKKKEDPLLDIHEKQ